jgi:type IV secretion system protein VirB6
LTVDALNMVLVAVLVFLVLRQVMPIASGLVGGSSLHSQGFIGRHVARGMSLAGRAAAPALRFAATHVAGGVEGVVRRSGAGTAALSRSWRTPRR